MGLRKGRGRARLVVAKSNDNIVSSCHPGRPTVGTATSPPHLWSPMFGCGRVTLAALKFIVPRRRIESERNFLR